MLVGRSAETATIDQLLAEARASRSGVLVVRGEAGVGKSSLLRHALEHADGMTVLRGGGVESESELAFAGVHQLLRPVLDRIDTLRSRRLRRCAQHSRSRATRSTTASASPSPCSASSATSPRTSRCCASSTTPIGSTTLPSRRSSSRHGDWKRSRSRSSSPYATERAPFGTRPARAPSRRSL